MSENSAMVKTGDLDIKIAAAACYVPIMSIGLIASIAFLAIEPKEHTEIRFHAAQSLLYTVALIASSTVGSVLMILLGVVAGVAAGMSDTLGLIMGLVYFLAFLLLMAVITLGGLGLFVLAALAFMEKSPKVPLLAGYAAKFSGHTL